MATAARAIIIEDGKILVMYRNKYGSQYFTLVGGQVADGESTEQALVREVREETGLEVASAHLVFIEEHAEPYNQQYIYACTLAPHGVTAIQESSEEGYMNRMGANVHTPLWVTVGSFDKLPFRTPGLHTAILHGLRRGFPDEPVNLSTTSFGGTTKSGRNRLANLSDKIRKKKNQRS